MVVDDSPDDVDILAKNLRIARFMLKTQRVFDAASLQEALERGKWDMVVSEWKLKNFSGRLALDMVKKRKPDLPFILYTSHISDQDMATVMGIGVRDVVNKSRPARIVPAIGRELDTAVERKEHRRAARLLKQLEDKHRAMIEGTKDAVAFIHDGVHIDANPTYLSMFGYGDADELLNVPALSLVEKKDYDNFKNFLRKAAKGIIPDEPIEFVGKKQDGSGVDFEALVASVEHNGENCLQLTVRNITKRKAAENRLQYLSQRDPLTGLYNRHYFSKLLSSALDDCKKNGGQHVLVYFDIYELKKINDSLGYTAGDRALLKITKLLKEAIDEDITLARFGGDEFILLLEGKAEIEGKNIEGQLKQLLAETKLSDKGKTLGCNCVSRVTVFGSTSGSLQDVITKATSVALPAGVEVDSPKRKKKAKPQGAAEAISAASPAKSKSAPEKKPTAAPASKPKPATPKPAAKPATSAGSAKSKVQRAMGPSPMQQKIKEALANNRFMLVYQPIINLHGDAEEYYEVLVRMVDENEELVSPGEFMAEAERSGQIKEIDRWVVEHAIEALAALHRDGREAVFFINMAEITLGDSSYIPLVKQTLEKAELDGQYLLFELDKSAAARNVDATSRLANLVKDFGANLSIDNCDLDLEALLNLPRQSVQFIKIPHALVREASNNEGMQQKLTQTMEMAEKLDVRTVAKGIEDAGSLSDLWTFGFEYVQGYYFQQAEAEISYDFAGEDEAELSGDTLSSGWAQ